MITVNVKDQTYGAKGDGTTNDTTAFQKAATAINAAGGGTVYIPPGTYVVGRQQGIAGEPILHIHDCSEPVLIYGNANTKLVAADGLKISLFNGNYATAYAAMIELEQNACVTVHDLELDGNLMGVIPGNPMPNGILYCTGTGIFARSNARVLIENVHIHSHALFGLDIRYSGLKAEDGLRPHTLINLVSEYNAGSGLQWSGGNGLTAINCSFNHSGQKRPDIKAIPSCGISIEPVWDICTNAHFINCRCINNSSTGLSSVFPESSPNRVFSGCTFWGITGRSIFVRGPVGVRFEDCRILGTCITESPGGSFTNCYFEDLPYRDLGVYRAGYVIGTSADQVLFDHCTIVSNRVIAVWADIKPKVFKNTTFIHKYDALLPAGTFQSLFRGSILENVHFKEDLAHPPTSGNYYIQAEGGTKTVNVSVDGPNIKWDYYKRLTGQIPDQTW